MWIYYGSLFASMVLALLYKNAAKTQKTFKIGKKRIPQRIVWGILVPLPLIIVMGLRSYVGQDYYEYLKIFVRTGYNVSKEIGYTAISKIAEFLSFGAPDKTVLFMLVAIITMGLFTAGWMRYPSKNLAMTVYLFVTMGYFIYALNIQRQYIAMAVIMFGIKWLNEDWKDMPKFFACVIIASLFHTSALIMIPAYFLLRKNWPLLFWFCVYLLAGVLCLIKWPVMKFVYHYLDGKVRFITMLTYFTTEFSPILIAIFAILSVMAVYFRGRLLRKSPQNTVLVNSMFTALLGYSFLTYIFGGAMIDRFTQYFAIMSVLFIPEVINVLKTRKIRMLGRFVVYGGFGAWLFKRLWDDGNVWKNLVPYAWELQMNPDTAGKILIAVFGVVLAVFAYKKYHRRKAPGIMRVGEIFPVHSGNYPVYKEPLVSVIIPVYNVEKYLPQCLDSLLAQTYKNFEAVAVNDGSPDGSLRILEEYARKDSRIKVFTKENGGIADVRNYGIEHASGELVAYVDSDDALHPDYLKVLVSTLTTYDADIAAAGFVRYYEDNGRMDERIHGVGTVVMDREAALKDYLSPATLTSVNTWNKVYKKSLFTENGIKFPAGLIYEDALTMHKIYMCAKRVVYTDEPVYYYRQRFGSIMNAKFDDRCLALKTIYPSVKKDLEDAGYTLEPELENYKLVNDLNMINAVADSAKPDKALFEEMKNEILSAKESYLKNPYVTRKQKLAMKLMGMGRPVYVFVRRMLKWLGNI